MASLSSANAGFHLQLCRDIDIKTWSLAFTIAYFGFVFCQINGLPYIMAACNFLHFTHPPCDNYTFPCPTLLSSKIWHGFSSGKFLAKKKPNAFVFSFQYSFQQTFFKACWEAPCTKNQIISKCIGYEYRIHTKHLGRKNIFLIQGLRIVKCKYPGNHWRKASLELTSRLSKKWATDYLTPCES